MFFSKFSIFLLIFPVFSSFSLFPIYNFSPFFKSPTPIQKWPSKNRGKVIKKWGKEGKLLETIQKISPVFPIFPTFFPFFSIQTKILVKTWMKMLLEGYIKKKLCGHFQGKMEGRNRGGGGEWFSAKIYTQKKRSIFFSLTNIKCIYITNALGRWGMLNILSVCLHIYYMYVDYI